MTLIAPARSTPVVLPAALPSLTGLRWVAALVVFAYHLRNLQYFEGAPQTALSIVFGAGSTAVSVFFVLSGFVLAWGHRPGDTVAVSWWRRIIRIYPLHLTGVLLASVVAISVYPAIRTTDPAALWANIFLVNSWHAPWWQAGNPVSWSLACEAFFYLLAPFLIKAVARQRAYVLGALAVATVVAIFVAPFVAQDLAPTVSSYSNPLVRLPEFVLGIIAGIAMRRGLWSGPKMSVALAALGLGYLASSVMFSSLMAPAAFTSIGAVLTIAALARRDVNGGRTYLTSPVLQLLGKASFSFYLIHLLTLDALQGLFPVLRSADLFTAVVGAVAALAIATGLGVVFHLGIEKPIARTLRPLGEGAVLTQAVAHGRAGARSSVG